jgi:ankyrin repeat protein
MKQILITIAAVVLVGCGPSMSIHDAATNGNIEVVKQHLASGTDVDVKDEEGATPLHYAASKGHKEIAKLLIAEGAGVNMKMQGGFTPLHFAAWEGHTEVAELFIAKGADVNAKVESDSYKGMTPLDLAKGHPEIAELLRKHGGKSRAEDSIFAAVMAGNLEAVKQHLAAGADVDAKDKTGFTPLHYAAQSGRKEIAELMIAEGAAVNAKDEDGDTPLDWATHPDNPDASVETADLLRKHGGKTGEELKAEGK